MQQFYTEMQTTLLLTARVRKTWFSPQIPILGFGCHPTEAGYAILGTGMLSDGGNVTDRNSSSELTSPKKWERIVLADACKTIDGLTK